MQRIKDLKLADPFVPFFVVLKDGKRLLVDQPHHVAVAPDGSRLGIMGHEGVTLVWPDKVQDVDVAPTAARITH